MIALIDRWLNENILVKNITLEYSVTCQVRALSAPNTAFCWQMNQVLQSFARTNLGCSISSTQSPGYSYPPPLLSCPVGSLPSLLSTGQAPLSSGTHPSSAKHTALPRSCLKFLGSFGFGSGLRNGKGRGSSY